MKRSLLKIVQSVLNDLDSDAVNSIGDTVESQQVAQIVQDCYYEMMGNRTWPHTQKVIQLEASTDLAKPNYLKLPENLKELVFFKYEKQKDGEPNIVLGDVKYLYPDEFLHYISNRNSENDNVQVVTDFNGTKLLIVNNAAPQFYTSFDDTYLVTDAYNSLREDTLQSSRTQALAYIIPSWVEEDEFVPDLPIDAFPALIEEVKSTASIVLRQVANQKAEQKAARQNRWLSRKSWRAQGGVRYMDFGRKGRK